MNDKLLTIFAYSCVVLFLTIGFTFGYLYSKSKRPIIEKQRAAECISADGIKGKGHAIWCKFER